MKRFALIFALVAAAVLPASALADSFAGSAVDPVDQPPALSGDATPDIVAISTGYDAAAGAVAADVMFSAPVSPYSPYNIIVVLSTGSNGFCFGGISLFARTATGGTGIVDRSGTTGALPLEITWDTGRTALHMQTSSPGLAGVAVNCAMANTSIPDDIGHCGNAECTYISHTYISDSVDTFSLGPSSAPVLRAAVPVVAPPVVEATPKQLDHAIAKATRVTADVKSYACTRKVVVYSSSVHRSGASGRVRYLLRGPGVKRVFSAHMEAGEDDVGHEFVKLKPGRYTLSVRYFGGLDDSQDVAIRLLASPTITKHFTLKRCG
jgi:hypothetical protein